VKEPPVQPRIAITTKMADEPRRKKACTCAMLCSGELPAISAALPPPSTVTSGVGRRLYTMDPKPGTEAACPQEKGCRSRILRLISQGGCRSDSFGVKSG